MLDECWQSRGIHASIWHGLDPEAVNGRGGLKDPAGERQPVALPSWTLMTSHGLVLLYLTSNPNGTIREVAEQLGLTERRVNDVIRDLSDADLIQVKREGRRNRYRLDEAACFRHPFISHVSFESFVKLWKLSKGSGTRSQP
jgi:DNA-binding transcriptional ArsR family regulator